VWQVWHTVRDSLLGNCRAQIVFFTMEKGLSSLESRRSARTCGQGLDPAGASALHALRRRGFLHGLRLPGPAMPLQPHQVCTGVILRSGAPAEKMAYLQAYLRAYLRNQI